MRTAKTQVRTAVAATLMLTAGCGFGLRRVCTLEAAFGVNVTLTDATGEPVTGATLVLTAGDYQETMQELRPGDYAGAVERAGTYSLSIQAEGFAPVELENLVVSSGPCHVVPISRDVTLSSDSGIMGVMLAGPQCPVVGPDTGEDCDDQPYAGTVIVEDAEGREVTRFTAAMDGTFRVPLLPGTYRLVPLPGPNGFPFAAEESVVVPEEAFVEVDISYDTGIR